ncbi:mitogen-activated protein kinase phosphatase 1 [Phytophthora cinnamomi]|uniref:mitogen-activated protein kinase phosphatase 1 n=1 Tax=Phytophthora cinnamomi TaxID=4785 RepID=UPI003559BD5B|nr:mitogen-activated protein kinase phosphatase 1 [Phytophthora cinnamomi]
MELAPVAAPFSGRASAGGEGSNAKRKLESAHSFFSLSAASSPSSSPTAAASSSYKPFRANADALPPLDSHAKVRRRATAGPPSLTRCYSDGKISKAFGELLTAEEAADGQRLPSTSKVCPTSPALSQQQKKSISPRAGVCPSPGLHRNPFLDEAAWPLSVSRGPTSASPAFVAKSYNNGTTPSRQSGDSCVMFTPPTPNKRVCSQQGFTQSKAGATVSAGNWAPSLTQARKRSLGASDAAHFASASPSDKRASLSIEMNLESRGNATSGALSSCSSSSSTPPVTVLPRGSVSAPKRMYPPQQRRSRNPGNLSLDLSQVDQANFDPCTTATGESKRRNDQAAVCSKLTDFLYIGGAIAAKNKSMLIQNGITHVINCAASVAPASFPDEFCYFNIRLRDHSSQDIARHFYSMFDFIERARECGGRIFLHCVKGISRSPTMAIAYLMWYKNIGMYKALDFVRQSRPIVDPNAGFIFQLTEWELLHPEGRIKFQRTIVFRMEVAYANPDKSGNCNGIVTAKNPLFVGPLPGISESYFRDPTKDIGELCLIVACPDYMFVWCGTDVNGDLVEAAESGAQILQRYEAFPAKCDTVRQGQEPVAFWDLIGDEI